MSSFINKFFNFAAAPIVGTYALAKLGAQQFQQGQNASGAMTLCCGAVVSREITRLPFSTEEPSIPR